jgi:hypothetical protein
MGGNGGSGFWLQATNQGLLSVGYPMLLQPNASNVLIGGTTDISGTGGLKIFGTTAGSAGAGALVVTGGLATGAASYFGGAVKIGVGLGSDQFNVHGVWSADTNKATATFYTTDSVAADIGGKLAFGGSYTGTTQTDWASIGGFKENATDGQYGGYLTFLTRTHGGNPQERLRISSTGAATFAGAVTIAGTVIHTLSATPASASATGTVGTMSWDASYIYICTATNTWKRVAIATW